MCVAAALFVSAAWRRSACGCGECREAGARRNKRCFLPFVCESYVVWLRQRLLVASLSVSAYRPECERTVNGGLCVGVEFRLE